MKKILLTLLIILALIGEIIIGEGYAQTIPPLKGGLVLNKSTYNSGEKIGAVLSIGNISGLRKITSKGLSAKPFHLFLVFTDPDGRIVTSNQLADTKMPDPPPPYVFPTATEGLVQGDPVEQLESGYAQTITIPNMHDYYTLSKSGKWSVKAMIPMRTYFRIDFPGPPVDYSRLDSVDFAGHFESNIVNFSILGSGTATGTINVRVEKHKVGAGNKPASTKEPIKELKIVAFNRSDSCATQTNPPYGVTWQNYKDIWRTCPHQYFSQTGDDGKATLILPPGDYIIIGAYDPDNNPNTDDSVYLGVSAGGLDPGETMNKYLQLIVKADGKNVPAKYTVVTGSELMIIEPEYIEWDGTQELYPFVFQSIGDWGVTTSVTPPEGFVADRNSLSTEVISEIRALQFIITDVGSKWEHTKVEYRIKHKGKSETIRSTVGVKLSERLSKQKGLDRFGHEGQGKK